MSKEKVSHTQINKGEAIEFKVEETMVFKGNEDEVFDRLSRKKLKKNLLGYGGALVGFSIAAGSLDENALGVLVGFYGIKKGVEYALEAKKEAILQNHIDSYRNF